MDIRSSLQRGLLTGSINVFVILLGLTGLVGTMVEGWLNLPSERPGAWALLLVVALWGGVSAIQRGNGRSRGEASAVGLVVGLSHGLLLAVFVWAMASLVDSGAEVRKWLAQLTPEAIGLLTFGLSPFVAALVVFAVQTAAGLAGSLLACASMRNRWSDRLADRARMVVTEVRAVSPVENLRPDRRSRRILYGAGLLVLLIAPVVLGQYWNYTLGTVGIYVILGLGLNIVVGLAGLLDLGYVAFFAIGAYTVGLLTAPLPHGILMDFWLVLPIGVALAAISGVLLGIPVLRMRGDYLAIVTLGFGEIIRILSKSDALTGFTGGPRGVRGVGSPSILGMEASGLHFMYLIVLSIVLVAYVTSRLQHSRVGRAWMAMREDQDVAEAMGINILKYKLLAFATGAAFAGFGGVIFASRNKFTGPEDFTLLVSINVLCLVIIGGMGSIPGVVMGALVLKGLPEILRQLDDYRMLVFGALLIVMMIVRPEGIWPSARRRMELHEHSEPPRDVVAEPSTGV
jgi:ABC-type branched-subunit amino acid transport system permease subunit